MISVLMRAVSVSSGVAVLLVSLAMSSGRHCFAQPRSEAWKDVIEPYLQRYCVECHGGEQRRGNLDLTSFTGPESVVAAFRDWQHISSFVINGEMPPEDAAQPTVLESQRFVQEVDQILASAAAAHAGDPGVVLPRRLSTAEFDQGIRELTGLTQRFTAGFPVDPAGGEGFTNTGEVLGMSPSLVRKFLQASQQVSEHLVLRRAGLSFSREPITSYNERRKLTEDAVIDFYRTHTPDMNEVLRLAGQTLAAGHAAETSGSTGYQQLVSDYLQRTVATHEVPARFQAVLSTWSEDRSDAEALRKLQQQVEWMRQNLSVPEGQLIRSNAGNWPISHLDFRDEVARRRGMFDGSQIPATRILYSDVIRIAEEPSSTVAVITLRAESFFAVADPAEICIGRAVFSRQQQFPNNEQQVQEHGVVEFRQVLKTAGLSDEWGLDEGSEDGVLRVQLPAVLKFPCSSELRELIADKRLLIELTADGCAGSDGGVIAELQLNTSPHAEPQGDLSRGQLLARRDAISTQRLRTFGEQFCSVFPDRFCYVDPGRGLSAGFHLVEGFFRDDLPLQRLVLTEEERGQLDQLWRELDFVTQRTETLLRGFVWFERSEREVLHDERFAFLRAEDPQLTSPELLERFEKLYLDRLGVRPEELERAEGEQSERCRMIHGFFESIRAGLREYTEDLEQAEGFALNDLNELAGRAWRRVLTAEDQQRLRTLYDRLRSEGQSIEESMRGLLIAVLMDPDFLFVVRESPEGDGLVPLAAVDLASRLSLFLWGTVPDQTLMEAVRSGELESNEGLQRQVRRMLMDQRVAFLAREFPGQWLGYADFPARDPISSEAFDSYDDELRQSMADEPTHLVEWLIRSDGSVLDLLLSDRTFLNSRLAAHYGGAIEQSYQLARKLEIRDAQIPLSAGGDWFPVDGLRAAGRGGLPGMAVILTRSSAGERGSAVKRGFWCVNRVLGQHFPPPPADVPELPASDQAAPTSLRELLAAHVANPRCAMCHRHFDGLGLALEGFDAIGRARERDAAGRAIDDLAILDGGIQIRGIPQLTEYMALQRQEDFLKTFCRRLLGYALGRSVQLSDRPLLEEMQNSLQKNDFRFASAIETIVTSSQFRLQRTQGYAAGMQPGR
jgi:hypothetical protein